MEATAIIKENIKEKAKEKLKEDKDNLVLKDTNRFNSFDTLDIEEVFSNLWKEELEFINTLNQAFDNLWQEIEKPLIFSQDKIKTLDFEAKGFIKELKEYNFYTPDGKIFSAKLNEVVDFERTITMPYARFEGKSVNSAGFLRDKDYFAKQYLEKYSETMSEYNKKLIEAGKSPIVDEVWVKYNLLHKHFMGEKLEHHHINNTDKAAYIPQSLHRGKINKDVMHVDNDSLIIEAYNTVKQTLGE